MSYRGVEKVGQLVLDEKLVGSFLDWLKYANLPKTHDLGGGSGQDNDGYNK